jgi:hypothetical protein
MATNKVAVAVMVCVCVGLIVLFVWLATATGSPAAAAAGQPGNWTAAQVATQASLFAASPVVKGLEQLGLDKAFVDRLSACAINDLSKRYGYDYVDACTTNADKAKCVPTDQDLRGFSSCLGGEKGKWSAEMMSLFTGAYRAAVSADAGAAAAAADLLPCILGYLSSNYSFDGVVAEFLKSEGGIMAKAASECSRAQ